MKNPSPLKCPKCGQTDVVEVSDGIVAMHTYKFDLKQNGYVLDYEDEENHGDNYLQCPDCDYFFPPKSYSQFVTLTK